MSTCPRCKKTVQPTAIACPHCQLELKAHGHPGMTLHRARDTEPLCATCEYDADNTCTFPKRPEAMTCTLYQSVTRSPDALPSYRPLPKPWWKANTAGIAFGILIAVSVAIALLPFIL